MANNFRKNLKKLRIQKGITQNQLAEKIGVDQSSISYWENGMDINVDNLEKIAEALNTPIHILLSKDLKEENYNNIITVPIVEETIQIPILGKIPAGIPIEAIENILGYEEIPKSWAYDGSSYFALQICGDSMFPKYENKDIIIVKQQVDCNSGNDCIVMVNGDDATFKRVIKQDDNIILKPLNNEYEPILFTAKDIIDKPVRIIGIAKEVRRKIN